MVARDAGSIISGSWIKSSIARLANQRPNPLVFASRFRFGRMRRPFDAHVPEVVDAYREGTAALIHGRVEIHAQARDPGSLHRIRGAA